MEEKSCILLSCRAREMDIAALIIQDQLSDNLHYWLGL